MKKFVSFLLAFSMAFLLCIPAYATGGRNEAPVTYEELIQMASEVFPEYADNLSIDASQMTLTRSAEDPVVVQITRPGPDGGELTYTEQASGLALVNFYDSWDVMSSSTSGSTTTVEGYYSVVSNVSNQVFAISGLKYEINSGGYDRFLSKGDRNTFTTCNMVIPAEKMSDDSSGDAFLQYDLTFAPNDYVALPSVVCRVTLPLGNDRFAYSAAG